jgi:ABC-type lipoprotein export system ATPase subunit
MDYMFPTGATIINVLAEHFSDPRNIKRDSALAAFKIAEKFTESFPYIADRSKPLHTLVINEGLFLSMETTFSLYESENRSYLDDLKTTHEKRIHQAICHYMKTGDVLLAKNRLKQCIPLTIRKDIACQALIGNLIDVVLFTIKVFVIHKPNRTHLSILSVGILYSLFESLNEIDSISELTKEVNVQTQLHNQRSHNMISCFLNVAENKDADGKFQNDKSVCEILDGIKEYTTKTLNESSLSCTKNHRFYKQQRLTTIILLVFNNLSILNTLNEAGRLVHNLTYNSYNLIELCNAMEELQLKDIETLKPNNKRSIIDWNRLNSAETPLYTIKKFKFCYPGTERIVLKNQLDDIHIEQNCWLQIKGPSGSGKSTLIKLFLKTIDSENPKSFVFLGHKDYDFLSIREFVSTNSVGNGLFYDTVEFNVYYSINHKNDNLVRRYFNLFGIGDYDAEKEKNINMMSSGQQQKIKAIRIILLILQRLHDPNGRHKQIFFLDEPTANMDPLSESIVLCELKRLRELYKLSFVFVSHSIAASQYADMYLIIGEDAQLRLEKKEPDDEIVLIIEDD